MPQFLCAHQYKKNVFVPYIYKFFKPEVTIKEMVYFIVRRSRPVIFRFYNQSIQDLPSLSPHLQSITYVVRDFVSAAVGRVSVSCQSFVFMLVSLELDSPVWSLGKVLSPR